MSTEHEYSGIAICTNNKGSYYHFPAHRKINCDDRCCIQPLTVGKKYKVIREAGDGMYYNIVDDEGEQHNYYKRDFIKLEEHRNKVISEIIKD